MKYNNDMLHAAMPFVSDREKETLQVVLAEGKQMRAAKRLGVAQSTLSNRISAILRRAQANGMMPDFGSHKKIPHGMRMKGISAYVDEAGDVRRSWLKLEQDRHMDLRLLMENLEVLLQDYKGVSKAPKKVKTLKGRDADRMVWYPIGDHHFGMYAWAEECGEDYDTEIANKLLREAIDRLVGSAPATKEAAILNVGDFFHMDNTKNVTNQSGNILDVDTRWTKVVKVGIDALRYCVDRMLDKHEVVHVYNVIGNHDTHTALALSMTMAAIFDGNPRVRVPVTANPFQYHEFGKCLIGMNHGDAVKKMDDFGPIMARDKPEEWGRTRFRYWWLGHIHNAQRYERPGVLIETFRTLAARDAWHAWSGYGAGRDMTAIVLHKDYGEIERHTVPVAMIKQS